MAIYTGTSGDDNLSGGSGPDELRGGLGNDKYFISEASDIVVEAEGEGSDVVYASVTYALTAGAHVETLSTSSLGATTAINLTGNELAQLIYGNAGVNSLNGGGGNDTLIGLGGNDVLNGGTGNDTMNGGAGNDIFHVDAAGDVIQEAAGGGSDIVYASVSYALTAGAEVETLSTNALGAVTAINLTGNAFGQAIYGNAGANVLNGLGGNDTLVGLGGNDTYYVDAAGDVISEGAGAGTDTVYASTSYTLSAGAHVETLSTNALGATTAINLSGNELAQTIYGNAGANSINGGGGNDTLIGLGGNDVLNGSTGIDTMNGGAGNDTFHVDAAGDIVQDAAAGGSDIVYASVNYTLAAGAEVETLSTNALGAVTAINLTGNAFSQVIYGNAGANVLNGLGGNDTMVGLGGNDIYHVDATGDVISEGAGAGTDTVYASVSYTLTAGAHVETLSTSSLGATTAINLAGNELAQTIYGNAGGNSISGGGGNDTLIGLGGNDTLNGGTGNDTLNGGAGNDIFHVDAAGDVIQEAAAGGNDTVYASLNYALTAGAEVETLSTSSLGAVTAINLTGNAFGQVIYGNAGANVLNGLGGNDTLIGLGGADIFAFTTALGAGNVDTISDFQQGVDKILLGGAPGEPFAALASGSLNDLFFTQGTQASTPFDLVIYNPATGALLYDADGNGAGAAMQFATLAPNLYLSWYDFEVSGPPNTLPTITSGPTASIPENSPPSTIVYQATASDANGDRIVWWLDGIDASRLTIDQSGAVRLNEPANFETQSSYSFTVVASDSSAAAQKSVTLSVGDVAEATPVITEKTEPNDDLYGSQLIDRSILIVADNPNLPNDDLRSATITGTISSPTDRDYFGIYLEAGEVIYLDVDNSSGNLDAFLEFFRINGGPILMLSDDDLVVPDPGSAPHPEYGHNTDSFIRIRVPEAGNYFFAISAFDDPEKPTSGNYELHVSIGPPATPAELLEEDIQALISGAQWDHTNLTYSFPTSASQYPSGIPETDGAGEFAPLTAAQQTAATSILPAIAAVSGLTFTLAGNAAEANLRFGMSGDPETAHAYYPSNLGSGDAGGTVWFNKTDYLAPTPGNYAWVTFLHETGHALGLKHGHESPSVSYGRDSLEYTVMTYRSYVGAELAADGGFTNETWGYPQTLMMLDIAALQEMYGANFGTNAGDTVYRWSPTTGEMSINGTGQGAPGGNRIFMTVWDGGGTDTYNFSDYSTRVVIDLRPGEWSDTGLEQRANLGTGQSARGNVANALLFEADPRSLIENAIGGSASDTLIANQALNHLTGGAGGDTFRWDSLADLMGPTADVVTDFNAEYIDLSRVDFDPSTPGRDSLSFIGTNAFGVTEGNELRWYTSAGNLVLQGDVNGDAVADFEIMLLGVTTIEHYQVYL